ncbi:V-set and transmembrane domain-containing protein 1 isoform X2 [Microcebus murinus]|uniref:V-set and transmembrane domain-containing protein 1 isoform X2 n=1 Tax=Microcebus murinus TaxID=30608 RepID=UPI000642BB38|nr:V-set and transmembrane domain-containing protein 1 isoform X2 [Microcebus murinus]
MITEFLSLLCLGLSLGHEEEKNERLPKPSLRAWPSWVAARDSSVTLTCQAPFPNATFELRKAHEPRDPREQSSAGRGAAFPLSRLRPEDAGRYFCAYKTRASDAWSEASEHVQLVVTGSLPEPSLSLNTDPGTTPGHRTLQCLIPYNGTECIAIALLKNGVPELSQVKEVRKNQTDFMPWNVTSNDSGNYSCVYYQCNSPHLGSRPSNSLEIWVTDKHDELGGPSIKKDTRIIFFAPVSCISIILLFLSVVCIYRHTQRGSSTEEPRASTHEESAESTSHSESPKPDATDVSKTERTSLLTEDPQGVSYVEPNVSALSEAASAPTKEPPGCVEYTTLKV